MNDFAYRLDLLRRINAVVIDGKPLSHRTVYGNYNIWQCFQNKLFYEDLRTLTLVDTPARVGVSLQVARVLTHLTAIWIHLRRPRVLVYSMDYTTSRPSRSDARLDPVYAALGDTKVRYIEVFHSTASRRLMRNVLYRLRLAVYDAGIPRGTHAAARVDWSQVDLSAFSDLERPAVMRIIEKYLNAEPRFCARVEFYKKLITSSSIARIVAIDDTRSYGELMLAARLCGVPAVAVQHGHYTKYHLGWLSGPYMGEIIRPQKLLVWSEYWRDELLRLGTYFKPEEIIVGGLKMPPPQTTTRDVEEGCTVVVPYEADSDRDAIRDFVDELLRCPDMRVLFKLRADRPAQQQLDEYGFTARYHDHFDATSDQALAVKRADVVAGTYSTYLYDMVEQLRPVLMIKSNSDFGEGMVRNGLAKTVLVDGSACDTVRNARMTSREVLLARREQLSGRSVMLMRDTIRKLL